MFKYFIPIPFHLRKYEKKIILFQFQLLTESTNGGPALVALGKNFRGGFSVKIISEERRPISAFIQAYTPKTLSTTELPVQYATSNY